MFQAKVPITKRNWVLRSSLSSPSPSPTINQTAPISVSPTPPGLKSRFSENQKGIGQKIHLINHLNQKISDRNQSTHSNDLSDSPQMPSVPALDSWKQRFKLAKSVFESQNPSDNVSEEQRVVDESFRFIDAEVNAIKHKGKANLNSPGTKLDSLKKDSTARRYSSQPHVSFSDEITFVHNNSNAEVRYFSSSDQQLLNTLYANVSKERLNDRPAIQPLQVPTDSLPTSYLYRNAGRDPNFYEPSLNVDRPFVRRPTVKVMPLKTTSNPLMKSLSLQEFPRPSHNIKTESDIRPIRSHMPDSGPRWSQTNIPGPDRPYDSTFSPSDTLSGMPEPMSINLGNWRPKVTRNDMKLRHERMPLTDIFS